MLWWIVQTTIVAALLAALACAAGRLARLRPAARHALWVVVLARLLTPPVVCWPWAVPGTARLVAGSSAADPGSDRPPIAAPPPVVESIAWPADDPPAASGHVAAGIEPLDPVALDATAVPEIEAGPSIAAGPEPPAARPEPIDVRSLLAGGWIAGAGALAAYQLARILRFAGRLRSARPAPAPLTAEVARMAADAGVRPPRVACLPGLGTPMLWCGGRVVLLVPDGLLERLDPARRRCVIAHEIAHLARRDHWVSRLALVAGWLWWWNPLYWWVCRRLGVEAELSCDAWVVRRYPADRRPYAEALLDVCQSLSRPSPTPALGIGGGSSRLVERRLRMILRDPARHSSRLRGVLAALLLATLGLPAWPRQAPDADSLPVALVVPADRPSPPTTEPAAGPSEPDAPLIRSDQRTFRVPFAISDAAREQVDEVRLYVSVDRGRTWSAADAAPPGRGAFRFRPDHDGEHWFAVRVRERDGRLTPPDTEALQPGLRVLVETTPAPDATDHIPILDPPAAGADGPCCLDPPTESEIWSKIPKFRHGSDPFYTVQRNNARFVIEKIGEKVDPPTLYPLAGRCELVHCHYKCTVYFDELTESDYPIPFSTRNGRVEVVYLDKDYLRRAEVTEPPADGDPGATVDTVVHALFDALLSPAAEKEAGEGTETATWAILDPDPEASRRAAAAIFGADHWSAARETLAFRLDGGWLFAGRVERGDFGTVTLEPVAFAWPGPTRDPVTGFAARRGRLSLEPDRGPGDVHLVLEEITERVIHGEDASARAAWDPLQLSLEVGNPSPLAHAVHPDDAPLPSLGDDPSGPRAAEAPTPEPIPDAEWPTWRVTELGPLTSGGGIIRVDGARMITKSDRFEVLGDGSRIRLERFDLFGGEPVDEGDGVDFALSSERATLVFDRPVVFSEPGPRRLTEVIGEGDLRLFVGSREAGDMTTLRSSGVVTLRFTAGSDRPLVEFRAPGEPDDRPAEDRPSEQPAGAAPVSVLPRPEAGPEGSEDAVTLALRAFGTEHWTAKNPWSYGTGDRRIYVYGKRSRGLGDGRYELEPIVLIFREEGGRAPLVISGDEGEVTFERDLDAGLAEGDPPGFVGARLAGAVAVRQGGMIATGRSLRIEEGQVTIGGDVRIDRHGAEIQTGEASFPLPTTAEGLD